MIRSWGEGRGIDVAKELQEYLFTSCCCIEKEICHLEAVQSSLCTASLPVDLCYCGLAVPVDEAFLSKNDALWQRLCTLRGQLSATVLYQMLRLLPLPAASLARALMFGCGRAYSKMHSTHM